MAWWRRGSSWRIGLHYAHVSLTSKHLTTERDLPQVFSDDPERSCDVRVMCETSDEGVELLRHDMQTLTVEGWAWPL
jgi:hypothetical protein